MSSHATLLARAVVTALLEGGVREIVLAPGSRNAPLSFAAYDAAEAGLVRLHTRIDERSAGFLALDRWRLGVARLAVPIGQLLGHLLLPLGHEMTASAVRRQRCAP